MALFKGSDNVNDILSGADFADTFIPGTSLDISTGDFVDGGAGNDLLIIDYSSQASGIIGTGGTNGSLSSSMSKVTYVNIERFDITATDFADDIRGGNFSDVLRGGKGDDVINGLKGNDTIIGGDGNDILRGGDGDDNISGGNGNDVLNGGGGTDTMVGGTGNDIYFVDRPTDAITENANEGYDTIFSSLDLSIASLANVEALTLINGSNAVKATGNDDDNKITGNQRDNILSGGAGNDRIAGGTGNDRLLGEDGADVLLGEDGDDLLIGGLGGDRLTGGAGADRFRFENAGQGVDVINDFSVGEDKIEFSRSGFGLSLPIGALSANNFVLGSAAADANDLFIYDSATGKLLFDSNGSASGGVATLAVMSKGLNLSSSDFRIVA